MWRYILIGGIVYASLAVLAWFVVYANKPATCSKGHTDIYHLAGRYRCRVCEWKKYVTNNRRRARNGS